MARVTWHGPAVKRALARGLEEGLTDGAEHLLEESRRVVPIEESTLSASGFTDVDGTRASVSFDGPYAVVQHERLDYQHDRGRTAKYLERPMMQERQVIGRIVARSIRRRMGGGLL